MADIPSEYLTLNEARQILVNECDKHHGAAAELARRAGVSTSSVCYTKSGKTHDISEEIALALGLLKVTIYIKIPQTETERGNLNV